MLSRVADAIYWMSRYAERAENVARFIDVNLHLTLEASGQATSWAPLVQTTGDHHWFTERYGDPSAENVVKFLTFDREYPNSVLSSISSARENARTVRDRISREMWQEVNEFYLMVKDASTDPASLSEMSEFYGRVKLSGIHFQGVTDATLSRGNAWHFAYLGRMLERADKTSRILDVKYYILLPTVRDVGTTIDQLGWTALLNSASALQMYRQQYHVTTHENVASFLLLDRDFPRSIHHCVLEARRSLHALTGTPLGTYKSEVERLLGELCARLDYGSIREIMRRGLHEYLDTVQLSLNEIGAAIRERFFATSAAAHATEPEG
ncbi:MAG TPA: alpha-E domain-containing protein [Polyangiaceae bacterium]|jgi:uncharacterized alpha-E superfamily protein